MFRFRRRRIALGGGIPLPATKPNTNFFSSEDYELAEIQAARGNSVHARHQSTETGKKGPDAIVRTGPEDPGTYTEYKTLRSSASKAVFRNLIKASKQLHPYGDGGILISGRSIGVTRETAEEGLARYVRAAEKSPTQTHRATIEIVVDDGTSIFYP